MRLFLAALVTAFILTACGTVAQVEPQQAGITIEMVEPTNECHVEAEIGEDDFVLFTASEGCVPHSIIPFRIVEVNGPEIPYDGGVYAHNTSHWPAWKPGAFEVRHRRTDALIGTITVPSR